MNRKKNDTIVVNKNTGTLSIRLIIIVVIKRQNAEIKGRREKRKGRTKGERMEKRVCARESECERDSAKEHVCLYIYIYMYKVYIYTLYIYLIYKVYYINI